MIKEYENKVKTPCYVVETQLIIKNLERLQSVQSRTDCKILLAQKAFSMYSLYPLISKYLKGTTASSLFEAKLGHDEMGGETHIFSPAYQDDEFDEIADICDHIVFNSISQMEKYRGRVKGQYGLRVNPEYSELETEIYNPCAKNSRLGVTLENLEPDKLKGVSGLHFHTMCEQNSDTLERTIKVFDEKFGRFITEYNMKWVNFGGGHHITRGDYDIETLINAITYIQNKYNVTVYLEPGEAVALNTGFLVATVLDTVKNNMDIAILDTSAACHMPDVLEMPYRPQIIDAGEPNEKPYAYRLGTHTCLAGDIIGDYSFDKPLHEGDKLVFCDMAHYTMVKNNTFNGINLPSIYTYDEKAPQDEKLKIIKHFSYEDFKSRLS